MARVWTDGAESGDTRFWDWIGPTSSVQTVSAPAPIGGTYIYAGCPWGAYKVIDPLTEFYIRYRIRATVVENNPHILAFRNSTSNVSRLSLDALHRFCVVVGNTIVDTSSVVMQPDTWYLVEIHFKLADAPNGIFDVYLDGIHIINYTGDTNPAAFANIDNIYWDTSAYTTFYLDDLALNDTTGIADNSWCGNGIITKMYPDGMGDTAWHGSDGDDISNHLLVDEFPDDGDLTYVYRDGDDSGTQDHYTLNDLDYTNKTILRIWPEARARKTSDAGYTLKLGILASGGADDMSAGRTLFQDDYNRIVGDDYTVNPVDSNPWEEADLDALEMIIEVG